MNSGGALMPSINLHCTQVCRTIKIHRSVPPKSGIILHSNMHAGRLIRCYVVTKFTSRMKYKWCTHAIAFVHANANSQTHTFLLSNTLIQTKWVLQIDCWGAAQGVGPLHALLCLTILVDASPFQEHAWHFNTIVLWSWAVINLIWVSVSATAGGVQLEYVLEKSLLILLNQGRGWDVVHLKCFELRWKVVHNVYLHENTYLIDTRSVQKIRGLFELRGSSWF